MTSSACSSDPAARPTLILSGSEDPLTLVLSRAGDVLAFDVLDSKGRGMPVLAPALARLLAVNGLAVADLAGVACVRGPGSFTGLRSILALGEGLAFGAGLPMAGLNYLPVLARGAAALATGRIFIAAYARSSKVYLQEFAAMPGAAPKALGAPAAWAVEQAAARLALAAQEGPLAVAGSAVQSFGQELTGGLPAGAVLPAGLSRPAPFALAAEALAASWSLVPPEPLYLRASDAEENLAGFAARRGVSPERASRLFQTLTARPVE